jgi:PAS domain S-box-containing protein
MRQSQLDANSEAEELRQRLDEAEETLRAIRLGEVDALVVSGSAGEKVFILRGADHAYRIIVEDMNEGAVTLSCDGTILYSNRRFADLLNLPLERVIGSSFRDHVSGGAEVESLLTANVRGSFESELRRNDGTLTPVFLSYNPVTVDETPCVCLIVGDLTEFKKQSALLEQERIRSEEKIRENQRLAVMGATAAVLAHEIANPLNGISTTVQVMQRHVLKQGTPSASDEFLRSNLTDLKLEIDRLGALLNDFRSLARTPQLNLAPINLQLLISEVFKMLGSALEESAVAVSTELPPDLPEPIADAERLKQVFLNLFKNAIEAMPSGGKLTVSANAQDENLTIYVADTGTGIPDGFDIFQPFMTTKQSGTGVGMAVVRELLSAHRASITYTSRPGEGTTFQIKLPIFPAPRG